MIWKCYCCLIFSFCFSSLVLAQKPSRVSEKLDLDQLLILSEKNLFDNPSMSLRYAKVADSIAQYLSNDSIRAVTLHRMSAANWSLGNQLEALENVQFSLQLAENGGVSTVTSDNLKAIGNIYRTSGLTLDAIGYYRSALDIAKQINDNIRILEISNELVTSFLTMSEYDSANRHIKDALSYTNSDGIDATYSLLLNMAIYEFEIGNEQEAFETLYSAIVNASKNKSKSGIIEGDRLMAEFLIKVGQPKEALQYALKAIAIANNSQIKELIYKCNKTLSRCYGELGEYEEAYKSNKIFEIYRDSLLNSTIRNELQMLSYYQRLFRLNVLESESDLNKELASQREKTIFGLAFVILFIFGLLGVIFMIGRKIQKQKAELEELNSFKSKILAIVSHDIKYPMQEVVGVINLFNDELVSKGEIEKLLPEIEQKTSALMELITNLLQWAEGQMDSKDLKNEEFSLVELLNEVNISLKTRLADKSLKVSIPENDVYLYSNRDIIKIVIRNLVTNAIKYSYKETTIKLNFDHNSSSSFIRVEDRGIGIDSQVINELFKNRVSSSLGTAGEIGSGVGLTICYDFIKRIGGNLSVTSEKGKGTTFTIEIPSLPVEPPAKEVSA